MTDFNYDVLQRKRLAQQAKYKKNGSRSKKCSLSTDNMTQKQWKERCGEMYTYNLDKPMTWKVFKELPTSIQKDYLVSIIGKYKANATNLGEMFGVTGATVKRHIDVNQMGLTFQVGKSMSKEERAVWETFLSGWRDEQALDADSDDDVDCEEALCQREDDPEDREREQEDKKSEVEGMEMKSFSLKFQGEIDPGMIANSILSIAGKGAVGTVEITCTF